MNLEAVAEVERTVRSVVHHIDRKRWAELREAFGTEVLTDYTSLFGGAPVRQAAELLIDTWRGALGAVVTQHLLGPIDVQLSAADSARASCHVRALHYSPRGLSGCEWEVLGHYLFELRRDAGAFRIVGMTLETFHQTGNRQLLSEAQRA